MTLTVTIEMDNAAIEDDATEIRTILRAVADAYESGSNGCSLCDVNGNSVGDWSIK